MNCKGIAMRTLLLLVIGILVVGIMVYLLYRTTTTETLSKYQCKSRVAEWCNQCKLLGWGTGGCDGPPKCPCLGPGHHNYDVWVKKCVDSGGYFNFDPSTTYNTYQSNPEIHCPKVGVY